MLVCVSLFQGWQLPIEVGKFFLDRQAPEKKLVDFLVPNRTADGSGMGQSILGSAVTDKPNQSWIGDWWEGWGSACLASDPHRLTQSDSVSLRLIY